MRFRLLKGRRGLVVVPRAFVEASVVALKKTNSAAIFR